MKLFLVSQRLLPGFRQAFEQLVGKPLGQTRVVLIENGADDEPGEPRWVKAARDSLTSAGMSIVRLDLRNYMHRKSYTELQGLFYRADAIWVGGGNTFYLNWLLKDSGARDLVIEHIKSGKVYAGGSAGAIIAGPTLQGFELADDPSFAPDMVMDGMAMTDIVVVPHWGSNDFGSIMVRIAKYLVDAGYAVQPLNDNEALLVDGKTHRVISVSAHEPTALLP